MIIINFITSQEKKVKVKNLKRKKNKRNNNKTNNKKYRNTKTNIVTFIKTLRLKNVLKDSDVIKRF